MPAIVRSSRKVPFPALVHSVWYEVLKLLYVTPDERLEYHASLNPKFELTSARRSEVVSQIE